jgi:hypothetical protein
LSGAPITVKEIGLIVQSYVSSPKYILIAREVLAAPVTIMNTEAYIFKIYVDIPYDPIVAALFQSLFGAMRNYDYAITDITNTSRAIGNVGVTTVSQWYPKGASGNDTWGMLAGSGVTPVDVADYCMETLITQGTGAGQLVYGTTTLSAMFVDGGKNAWYITRTVTNNSGGNVTINEVGLVIRMGKSVNYYFLVARKKLSAGLVLADGEAAILRLKVVM